MPRLPILSSREVVRGLERLGFQHVSQSGSHIKLRRQSTTVIVPAHRDIRRGTLASILQQAGLTIDQLIAAMMN